jgi:UDP-N-acetylmuramyl pentapeptide phosphotransferase/UDP-N-acetylglucosamine-1-phosphate transferase
VGTKRIVGVILIALGVVSLIWGGISWTREKTVIDIGPLEARAEQREHIPLPPVLGGLAFVAGVILVLAPERRRV